MIGHGPAVTAKHPSRKMKSLRVATCQFPVSSSIAKNLFHVLSLIGKAADAGAEAAHFSETCLAHYPGVDMPDLSQLDWQELTEATRQVQPAAARRKRRVL